MTNELKSGTYQHYSGLIVLVIGTARHSETEEKLVAYIPLGVKKGPRITVRPYTNFFDDITFDNKKQPRFKYLGEEVPENIAANYSPLSK